VTAILVGTSSWADRLMLNSGWYPREVKTPAERLAYYAERFPIVEVDTSYYAIPAVETAAAWVDCTPDGFRFDVKAFGLFTGHATAVNALPAELRPRLPAQRRVQRRDLPPDTVDALWARFHEFLAPIAAAGKLGVVLLQFPPWLADTAAARHRIADTAARCRPARVAVELRHRSWFTNTDRTLDTLRFLQAQELSFCCVDMPQGHPSSIPPIVVATAEPALVRFHGHSRLWSTGDKQEKFRYAYRDPELRDWAQRLRALTGEVDEVHALMNNCCGDQAPRDAARLAELVAARPARR
jgi:uncharacterized protein YecE (DUF72 family)